MTVDAQLDTLEAKGLIRLASYQPELEYLFRHWLVQDAAYGSLLRQERRELHGLVGQSLEALYPDRGAELAGILAMHFELAGQSEKAVRYFLAEGQYALERNALREAFSAFDRARAMMPEFSEDEPAELRRRRLEAELGRARAGWTSRPIDEVITDLSGVVDMAEALGDLELLAQVHLHLALMRLEKGEQANTPEVQRSLDRVAQIGASLNDPALGALPLALVGLNKVFVGPIREGVAALEDAIPLMDARGDFIGAAFARGWLAIGYGYLGDFDKAEAAARFATEQAAAKGDLIAQLDAQIAEAMVRSQRGQLDEALPIAQACVERSAQTGATACAVVSSFVLGDVYQRQGRFREARDALQIGITLAPVTGADSVWRPTLQAWLGFNAATLGDDDETGWDEALDAARQVRNRPGEAGIHGKRAEALARRGDHEAALQFFEESAAIWEEQGARPPLARTLRAWGESLRAVGREDEGVGKLNQSLALLDELGIEREAAEVREVLAAP